MTLEILDHVKKYRNDSLNIGELIKGTKIPKSKNGKIIWHNEINENPINPKDGLCVFCGLTSMNLMVLDLDDETLFEHFKNYLDQTFIVKTGKKGFHLYFRTFENLKSKSLTNSKGQHIDILGQGKIAVLPPSIHPDTNRQYEIISDKKIKQLTTQEEQGLYQKLKDLGFAISEDKKPVSELHDKNFVKTEGQNRGEDLLRVIDSWKIKNPELTESMLFLMANEYNNLHFNPPYPKDKVKSLVKQGIEFIESKNQEQKTELKIHIIQETNPIEIDHDVGSFTNKQWPDVAKTIQSMYHFVTLRETKQMWFYNEKEGVYRPNADTILEEECQKLVRCCTIKTRNEVKATIKSNRTMIESKELFESTHINTQNGILNPKTFELLPHSHEYLTTTKLPFAVNFNARNLKLWNHILTIIEPKDINLIMELIWICISWKNPFKKMFVFKGVRNTQKTTLSDIIVWIIGEDNVSREKPQQFLAKDTRFSTSKFIGKRMNTASEIGNLSSEMIENLKALVGAEKQNTEKKNDNTERYFDSTKFVFLYTTNTLGKIYSSVDDDSIITRFQFLIFSKIIEESKANGLWYDDFFKNDDDRKSAIETIVNIVINYKKAQSLGRIPQTNWSNIIQTKRILKEQMPLEEKYFEDKRIIIKDGERLTLDEINKDFIKYVGFNVNSHKMGIILKHNGFKSNTSNGITYFKGVSFDTKNGQEKFG